MQRLFPTSRAGQAPTDIYDDVLFPAGRGDRPYVALNMVSTVDGKTTIDEGRQPGPIGSPVDRQLMGRLRIGVDAVMRGAATVRKSPYYPGVPEDLEHRRIDRGLERQPLVIIVTASGDVPFDAPIFQEAPRRPLIVAPTKAKDALSKREDVADTLFVGDDEVHLPVAMKQLYDEYGIRRVLSEGGPRLNYECMKHNVLDELFWTVAPKIDGNRNDLTLVHGPASLLPLPELQLLSAYANGSELFLRYKTVDPADAAPSEKGVRNNE